jgi:hypothetical protein
MLCKNVMNRETDLVEKLMTVLTGADVMTPEV